MKKTFLILALVTLSSVTAFSQLGIRAGVNMANQIKSFDNQELSAAFHSSNLTGYQVGLVYQLNPAYGASGMGLEVGALFSQKGGMFKLADDKTQLLNSVIEGYKELNYIEVPISARYRLNFGGVVGAFASAGVYGGIAVEGNTTFKSKIGLIDNQLKQSVDFDDFMDRIDYGFNLGVGVELIEKIQIGFNWTQGLQKKDKSKGLLDQIKLQNKQILSNIEQKSANRVFSVSVTYLF